jgi:hypothetical protein
VWNMSSMLSAFSVDAQSEADVQATVLFASQHNLRLVVKSTGHDVSVQGSCLPAAALQTSLTHFLPSLLLLHPSLASASGMRDPQLQAPCCCGLTTSTPLPGTLPLCQRAAALSQPLWPLWALALSLQTCTQWPWRRGSL